MSVGQVQYRLMRQLLGMIGPRAPLEDDLVLRIDDVQVADPAAGGPVDMALDELRKFLVTLAGAEAAKVGPGLKQRHASLPHSGIGPSRRWPRRGRRRWNEIGRGSRV